MQGEQFPMKAAPPAARFTLEDLVQMGEIVARSAMFAGVSTPQQATALLLLCQAEGLHPMQALKRYHIIEGRPSMRADNMQAEFQARGGHIEWVQYDDVAAVAIFSHPQHCPKGIKVEATYEEFQKSGITAGKYGEKDNWKRNRAAMLRARLISRGVRMVDPGTIVGFYTPEEVVDFEPCDTRSPIESRPEILVEKPQKPEKPQNKSGYGRGQYANPDQVRQFTERMKAFLEKANRQFLDQVILRQHGEIPDGIREPCDWYRMTGHLMKWAEQQCLLADMKSEPKQGQIPKYLAIVFHRNGEELVEEMRRYFDQCCVDELGRLGLAEFEADEEREAIQQES
jgi:hypothetical protein